MKENQYFPQSMSHPGETLAEKLEEMSIGIKEFALLSGESEKTILEILNGKSKITSEIAERFEAVTKISVKYWLNHQRLFDEFYLKKK